MRSCIEEDMADGYEVEVEVLNEDVAEYSELIDCLTLVSFILCLS